MRMNFLIIFLFFFFLSNSYAITLNQAVSKITQNENWQRSINQVMLRQIDIDIAKSAMLPTLNLRGALTKQDQTDNNFVDDEQHQVLLNLTQPLFHGLREFRSKNYAQLLLKAQKLVNAAAQRELAYN